MTSLLTRVGLALMWLLHFLPLSILAHIGHGVGLLFWMLGKERRQVAETNLRLCFPEMSPVERRDLVRQHFGLFGRSVLERSILWWASEKRILSLIQVKGQEHFDQSIGKPLILLAPHFVGLDVAGNWVANHVDGVSIYAMQKNRYFSEFLRKKRARFRQQILFSRQEGLRGVIRAIRDAHPFYYLPDQDFGPRDALFVPFFGVETATIPTASRLAKLSGATVVPVTTRILPGGEGYEVTFYPPWEQFPSDDLMSDTRRMNAFIEDRVREMPAQYFWLHKRFKTRPPGEGKIY